ncbi:MAG: sigma-54-dependent transcriptional regulator [Planctomycetota bacterium]|jgi:DNA-binding NtrC family response regulator
MNILLADDEKILRVTVRDALEDEGHNVLAVENGREAIAALSEGVFDCVVTDLKMPEVSGEEVLRSAVNLGVYVIVITGAGSISSAVEAIKVGAFDYIEKPFEIEELHIVLGKLAEMKRLKEELAFLRSELDKNNGFKRIIGISKAITRVVDNSRKAAGTDAGILIEGESGTGKEILARAIHEESSRKGKPFVVISCGILSESLLESELFGHEKGAFTGAESKRIGRFESAQGGTVFLDDIDDMPLATQVKLLRVLQERTVERIGSSDPVAVDIRVIAATKVDLLKMSEQCEFREDLYYRLNVVNLKLPALQERTSDIPLLCAFFMAKYSAERDFIIEDKVMQKLTEYSWPGNIRELENSILRAVSLSSSACNILAEKDLLSAAEDSSMPDNLSVLSGTGKTCSTLVEAVSAAERDAIRSALQITDGNKTKAAAVLGISRKHLWDKMKKLEI